MNPIFRTSAAVTLSVPSDDDGVLALDEVLHEALRGSESALHVAAYELRGRLIFELWPILEPYGCEQAAEDLADDTLLAVLEGEVRARRGQGRAIAAVLCKARRLARQHLKDRGKRWGIDGE
jgi:hypothetical protein